MADDLPTLGEYDLVATLDRLDEHLVRILFWLRAGTVLLVICALALVVRVMQG